MCNRCSSRIQEFNTVNGEFIKSYGSFGLKNDQFEDSSRKALDVFRNLETELKIKPAQNHYNCSLDTLGRAVHLTDTGNFIT